MSIYDTIKETKSSLEINAEDYYDPDMSPNVPANLDEWGVAFEGGFGDHQGNIGTELSINYSFSWGDEKWTAVAAYICDEGLVLDYFVEINQDRLKKFLDEWKQKRDGFDFPPKCRARLSIAGDGSVSISDMEWLV